MFLKNICLLLLFSLSLKSVVRLTPTPVVDFVFLLLLSLLPFDCRLHHPSPLLIPALVIHAPPTRFLHAALQSQSRSSSSTLYYDRTRSLHQPFPFHKKKRICIGRATSIILGYTQSTQCCKMTRKHKANIPYWLYACESFCNIACDIYVGLGDVYQPFK